MFIPDPSGMLRLITGFNAGALAVAERAAQYARDNAPVLTGALRDSIHVEETRTPGEYQIVTATGYGAYPELGTANMAAEPFLVPGANRAMDEFAPLIAAGIALHEGISAGQAIQSVQQALS